MPKTIAIGLRGRFILYLVFVHLLFAGVAIYLLSKDRVWLLAVEAVFIASLYLGVRLIRNLFGTIELINTGAQFIEDSDFTSRFREVGQAEMDRLIQVYNRMADNLREERARQQERNFFLDKIVTASASGIVTFDFDGRIATINPMAERLLGAAAGPLIGEELAALEHPLAAALAELAPGESRILPLAGRRRLRCLRAQFLDRGFTRDFLLLEELTEELRQAEKTAYEKVIRLMSHEVNNSVGSANSLLHSCLHYADQLGGEDRADFETAMRVVIDRTDHLNTFMRNFADVFRLPAPQLQPWDLRRVAEETLVLFRADFARRGIEVELDARELIGLVRLDRNQMEQVFLNLFKNAAEAIGERGRITLRIGLQAGRPFIVIEDTGAGIPPAVRANLFTPFFSTRENGQGIGLTLVQEILDQHGFEFTLESEPGRPTQFTIWF
ncbi:MAG: ATP-binding protein [Blastocatellia bacterium]|nr:ATP-binding protein [Blastocatellia bacterium]